MSSHVEFAPAKLNLALHVLGKRPDGYHEIETLVAFAGIGDTVSAEPADRDEFVAEGPFASSLPPSGNLVEMARDALRAHSRSSRPVRLVLTKRLPVASGIGGGSADAAATLRALARFWRLGSREAVEETLCEVGARIGADVPMCVLSRPLVARGIGEKLTPVPAFDLAEMACVIVNPLMPLETPEVFSALKRRDHPPLPPLGGRTTIEWLRTTRNDLAEPARRLVPLIGEVLDALSGATLSRMSGSGATCFGLYENERVAAQAANRIGRDHPDWFVRSTTLNGMRDKTEGA